MRRALAAFVAQRKDLVEGLHVWGEGDAETNSSPYPRSVLTLEVQGDILHRGPVKYVLTEAIFTQATTTSALSGSEFQGVQEAIRDAVQTSPAWFDATGVSILTQQLRAFREVTDPKARQGSRPSAVLRWEGLIGLGRAA